MVLGDVLHACACADMTGVSHAYSAVTWHVHVFMNLQMVCRFCPRHMGGMCVGVLWVYCMGGLCGLIRPHVGSGTTLKVFA